MILEVIKILQNIVLLLPSTLIICLIVWLVNEERKKKVSFGQTVKAIFCMAATISIIVCSFIFSMTTIVLIGKMWEEYETSPTGVLVEPMIKEISYFSAEAFILITGCVVILVIWYLFLSRQIIPGEGNIKKRIKEYFEGRI